MEKGKKNVIILQLYVRKEGKKPPQISSIRSAIPYFGSGGGETTCRRAASESLLWTGVGNGGKEMKIRYVFILLIIIVLALFKKMAD